MKPFWGVLAILLSVIAASGQALNQKEANRLADAIYRAEGGAKAKVPYGILSVKVRSKLQARKICLNTIQNTYRRWLESGKQADFVDFLADRYCPPSDSEGNKNWKRNVRLLWNPPKPLTNPAEQIATAKPSAPVIEEAAGAKPNDPKPDPAANSDPIDD
jgi:hypothetical protein